MLMRFLISRLSWKSFAVGMGAAAFGSVLVKPILASAVKTGLDVKDFAAQTYAQAKLEALSIKAEAEQQRAAQPDRSVAETLETIRAELKQLRADVAAVKPQKAT